MGRTLRTEKSDGVFSIVLTRAAEYNTITLELRDELAAAIDDGDVVADDVEVASRRVQSRKPLLKAHALLLVR